MIFLLLIPDPPSRESPAEDINAFLLKHSHHFGLEMSLGLGGFMIVNQGLESASAYLRIIKGISVSILSLLQGIDYEGTHDLHVCSESPEDSGPMALRVFLQPICSIVDESIEMLQIQLVFVELNCFVEVLSIESGLIAGLFEAIEVVLGKREGSDHSFI